VRQAVGHRSGGSLRGITENGSNRRFPRSFAGMCPFSTLITTLIPALAAYFDGAAERRRSVNGVKKMNQKFSYEEVLSSAERYSWRVDDLIGGAKQLDFAKPFLPETLARTRELDFLDRDEQRSVNQIRGHGYLYTFGLVESSSCPSCSTMSARGSTAMTTACAPC
jgi:hypothetical protein